MRFPVHRVQPLTALHRSLFILGESQQIFIGNGRDQAEHRWGNAVRAALHASKCLIV